MSIADTYEDAINEAADLQQVGVDKLIERNTERHEPLGILHESYNGGFTYGSAKSLFKVRSGPLGYVPASDEAGEWLREFDIENHAPRKIGRPLKEAALHVAPRTRSGLRGRAGRPHCGPRRCARRIRSRPGREGRAMGNAGHRRDRKPGVRMSILGKLGDVLERIHDAWADVDDDEPEESRAAMAPPIFLIVNQKTAAMNLKRSLDRAQAWAREGEQIIEYEAIALHEPNKGGGGKDGSCDLGSPVGEAVPNVIYDFPIVNIPIVCGHQLGPSGLDPKALLH